MYLVRRTVLTVVLVWCENAVESWIEKTPLFGAATEGRALANAFLAADWAVLHLVEN